VQITPYNTGNTGCASLVCPAVLGPNPQYNSAPGLNPALAQLTETNPGVTNP
jgi:hypothetical protein